MPGSELPAPRRLACLEQHRDLLRGSRQLGRTTTAEELPFEIDFVNLVGIGEQGLLRVTHERVLVPALPQGITDLHELFGTLIACVMLAHLGTEIVREPARVKSRHDVKADAPLRQVIHGRGHAGERPRL